MAFPDSDLLLDAYENPSTRAGYKALVVEALLDPDKRQALNAFYNRLNLLAMAMFQVLYADLFRERPVEIEPCTWTVNAMGTRFEFPLRTESLWLDWTLAASFLGQDMEVKGFYFQVIESRFRPRTFLDVGGNYGTHSIFFLSQGVDTVTFEPNPGCVSTFQALLEFNGMQGDIVEAAVGAEAATATLSFPTRETWLGSITLGEEEAGSHPDLQTVTGPVVTLDQVVQERGLQPGLVKIDTEGFELQVVLGARETLETHRPMVLFESNTAPERTALREAFETLDYSIYRLNAALFESPEELSDTEFLADEKTNFMALPAGHPMLRPL